jgi:hypothetical protein
MRSALDCCVCFNELSSVGNVPLILPCGHTLCEKCVAMIQGGKGSATCPECRAKIPPKRTPLKRNYQLMDAADEAASKRLRLFSDPQAPLTMLLEHAHGAQKGVEDRLPFVRDLLRHPWSTDDLQTALLRAVQHQDMDVCKLLLDPPGQNAACPDRALSSTAPGGPVHQLLTMSLCQRLDCSCQLCMM